MAKTLKELIDEASVLLEEYGDIPLDTEICMNEMPGNCHKAFSHEWYIPPHIVEVDVIKKPY